jgi:predicted nucleic acid-binding protein
VVDAFDADVLIYAAVPGHPLGRRVLPLLPEPAQQGESDVDAAAMGIGSVLLLPELLSKPVRDGADDELLALAVLLGRLELRPVDEATAELAVPLGAAYRLRAADAVHLATAVLAGAERFVTNNRADFDCSIAEIDVTFPWDLPDLDLGHQPG